MTNKLLYKRLLKTLFIWSASRINHVCFTTVYTLYTHNLIQIRWDCTCIVRMGSECIYFIWSFKQGLGFYQSNFHFNVTRLNIVVLLYFWWKRTKCFWPVFHISSTVASHNARTIQIFKEKKFSKKLKK